MTAKMGTGKGSRIPPGVASATHIIRWRSHLRDLFGGMHVNLCDSREGERMTPFLFEFPRRDLTARSYEHFDVNQSLAAQDLGAALLSAITPVTVKIHVRAADDISERLGKSG